MNNVYGIGKHRRYFEGWYFKQQNKSQVLALIPAFHVNKAGQASASLQVITDARTYNIDFHVRSFHVNRKKFLISLDNCTFSEYGCRLDVRGKDCTLRGKLHFGPFTSPLNDIMGPFRLVPFMECRHSVFSLFHRVDGSITIDGRQFVFENGSGYVEGDRGVSFPKRYLWTQCIWNSNSIMLSIADIPFYGRTFAGCIGFVYVNGKEYRIATYCGVKLLHVSNHAVILKQGDLMLKIKLLQSRCHSLHAPREGSMSRTIQECVLGSVEYTCSIGKKALFHFVSGQASFESNWGNVSYN